MTYFTKLKKEIEEVTFTSKAAIITEVTEGYIKTKGSNVPIGSIFECRKTKDKFEVLKSKKSDNLLLPYGNDITLKVGDIIYPLDNNLFLPKNIDDLIGRVIDGFGNPIDDLPLIKSRSLTSAVVENNPLERKRIDTPIETGVKAIDGLLTIGRGQRIGLFSGTGVGKTTLLGMLSKQSKEDLNVIALIGERGREVREFIEKDLGVEGLKRSVVIVATSEQSPLMQIKSAELATTIAEHFREKNKNVLLMMDSVTRYLMAKRVIDIAGGDIPVMGGKTLSMEPSLQKLLERAGTSKRGSITGIYTVLVEGDEFNSPIPDMARGILDGHIVLTRELANKNHFPAIDVLSSISRVMLDIIEEEHLMVSREIKKNISIFREIEDQINLGLIEKGVNPEYDKSIRVNKHINRFLQQGINESVDFEKSVNMMKNIINEKNFN